MCTAGACQVALSMAHKAWHWPCRCTTVPQCWGWPAIADCACLLQLPFGSAAAQVLRPLCRGEAVDCYVPQSVMTSDGHVLDVDIVLNEMFKDGDELHVEYSAGPKPFAARQGNAPVWSGSAESEASAAALWLADAWDIWSMFSPVLPCEVPAVRQVSLRLLCVWGSNCPS